MCNKLSVYHDLLFGARPAHFILCRRKMIFSVGVETTVEFRRGRRFGKAGVCHFTQALYNLSTFMKHKTCTKEGRWDETAFGVKRWRAACVTNHWVAGAIARTACHCFAPNAVSSHFPSLGTSFWSLKKRKEQVSHTTAPDIREGVPYFGHYYFFPTLQAVQHSIDVVTFPLILTFSGFDRTRMILGNFERTIKVLLDV